MTVGSWRGAKRESLKQKARSPFFVSSRRRSRIDLFHIRGRRQNNRVFFLKESRVDGRFSWRVLVASFPGYSFFFFCFKPFPIVDTPDLATRDKRSPSEKGDNSDQHRRHFQLIRRLNHTTTYSSTLALTHASQGTGFWSHTLLFPAPYLSLTREIPRPAPCFYAFCCSCNLSEFA